MIIEQPAILDQNSKRKLSVSFIIFILSIWNPLISVFKDIPEELNMVNVNKTKMAFAVAPYDLPRSIGTTGERPSPSEITLFWVYTTLIL